MPQSYRWERRCSCCSECRALADAGQPSDEARGDVDEADDAQSNRVHDVGQQSDEANGDHDEQSDVGEDDAFMMEMHRQSENMQTPEDESGEDEDDEELAELLR